MVGQEYDRKATKKNFAAGFDPLQSFSGKLSQVELWNAILTPKEIQNIANCGVSSTKSQNRILTWKMDAWKLNGQTTFEDIPLKQICQKNIVSNQFIWPRAIDFETFSRYCNAIDGIAPLVYKYSQWEKVYNDAKEVFVSVNKTFPSGFLDKTRPNGIRCFTSKTNSEVYFWAGMKWNDVDENWFSPSQPSVDISNFKFKVNSGDPNCIYFYENAFEKLSCQAKSPCGLCKVPENKVIYLKGLCQSGYDTFDMKYYVDGLKNNRPYFK